MSPRIKICNEFDWFLSLRCLAPPESYMGYWEKIRNSKSELKDTNEHVFPPKNTCDISPLEHQASSIWDPWVFSPPGNLFLPLNTFSLVDLVLETFSLPWCDLSLSYKLWCDLSLPPFDINFHEGLSGIRRIGLVLETRHKAMDKNVMLVEDKIHWLELDQKKYRTSGKLFFLLWNRWHRVTCFGGTEKIRLDRKLQVGETEFITEKNTCHLSSLVK